MPGVPTGAVAQDVARRAATYRLGHADGEMPQGERARFAELTQSPPVEPLPRAYATYFFYDIPTPLAAVYEGGTQLLAAGSQGA